MQLRLKKLNWKDEIESQATKTATYKGVWIAMKKSAFPARSCLCRNLKPLFTHCANAAWTKTHKTRAVDKLRWTRNPMFHASFESRNTVSRQEIRFSTTDLRGSKSMRQPRRKYRIDSWLINVDTGKRSVIMRSRATERPMRAANV